MNDLQKLASFLKDIKFTMMNTIGKDGSIYSRPMATLDMEEENFDGRLWFFTRKDSPKVTEIESEQHINLAYADPDKQRYASVSGRGTLVQDRALMEKLWKPVFKAWFPEGLEDPEIALISVQVESAELWDSPPSKVVQLAGFVKSTLTGKPYNHQEHVQHINVNPQH